jgi:hypothetical protein
VRGQAEERSSKRTTCAVTVGAQASDPDRGASGWLREDLRPAGSEAQREDLRPVADAQSYRVRVRCVAGPRTRTLTIEAASHEAARGEALRYTGEGWRIIDVEAL